MEKKKDAIFTLNEKISVVEALPISLQHVLAMIVGNVAPAIIVAGALGLSVTDKALLIQYGMLTAGIGTLVQVIGFWKFGSRLPLIMGLNFSFVPIIIAIGKDYSLAALYGANIIGGLVVILFGAIILKIRRFFPHLVTGVTVLTMGVSLYPVAINYMAGGVGVPDYGTWKHWLVALVTLAVVYIISEFGRGYFKIMAILFGIIIGYLLALSLGMVTFEGVADSKIVALPAILPFGIEFNISAIITLVVMYLVTSVEVIGDISSLTIGGMDRDPSDEEISYGLMGKGLTAMVTSFFGGTPTATFSQNVGIVTMTKAVNRKMAMIAGVIILLCGFVPIFGAVMSTIPNAVLGGATLTVFAIISVNGMRIIAQEPFTMRNCSILGVALAIGIGIAFVPNSLEHSPKFFQTFFGSSPVIISTLIAFILNLIIPKKTFEQEEEERSITKK